MLIIPVFNKATRIIPYVCITLIAINSFIFFFLQAGDGQVQEEAYAYYDSSGLLEMELEAYLDYLRSAGDGVPDNVLKGDGNRSGYLQKMFSDSEFRERLENEEIITPQDENYPEWYEKRKKFKGLLKQSVISRFGYSPKDNNLVGLFTCMFLHGGIMHLVGNMVFLWLVGAVLEKAIGAFSFLALYLICGVCASALFGLIYPSTPGPLVGASGAIAGLMGAYGIIFAMRRIRVFYSVGFYFDYAVLPAIVLFPVWLANEFFQLFTNQGSHVAYVAHIGGLLSGVLIGIGYRKFQKNRIEELFQEEEKSSEIEILLDRGQEKFLELDIDEARIIFNKVLSLSPDNQKALRHLFLIEKTSPQSEEFHRSAYRLLHNIGRDNRDEYLQVFEEYRTVSGKPRVTLEILERVTHCYLASKNFDKAANCIASMLKRAPENRKLPNFLLKLAHGFRSVGKTSEAVKCYRLLSTRFTACSEGTEAAGYLNKAQNPSWK